jgi:hypothetical protein
MIHGGVGETRTSNYREGGGYFPSFSSPTEIGGSRDQICLEDMGTQKALILHLAGSFRLSLDVKDIVKA